MSTLASPSRRPGFRTSIRAALPLWLLAVSAGYHCAGPSCFGQPVAQCVPGIEVLGAPNGLLSAPRALLAHDIDGQGPHPREAFFLGSRALVAWNGSSWRAVAQTISTSQRGSMTTFDPDGTGPLSPALVATAWSNPSLQGVGMLSGQFWMPVGGRFDQEVYALTTWDPDDDGSQPALLIAGGRFTQIGQPAQARSRIAAWNGTTWSALGTGLNSDVLALTTWDQDGSGPAPSRLVAGGLFSGPAFATGRIALWNGSAWSYPIHPTSTSFNEVGALTTFDHDANGDTPRRLVIGGSFLRTTTPGRFRNLVQYDGSQWSAIGAEGPSGTVRSLTVWDRDAQGLSGETLVVSGDFFTFVGLSGSFRRVALFDGTTWAEPDQGLTNQPFGGPVLSCVLDSDGDGPAPSTLIAGGAFQQAGARTARFAAAFDNTSWQSLPAVDDLSLATSPQFAHVLPVGSDRVLHAITQPSNARAELWRRVNDRWQAPANSTLDWQVTATLEWDPDGPGPRGREILAGGSYWDSSISAPIATRLATWDGSTWVSLNPPTGIAISAITFHDTDGTGPVPRELHVAFTSNEVPPANRVARWDGTFWHNVGPTFNFPVEGMVSWDRDNAGPQPPQLIACGGFTNVGGVPIFRLAGWTGVAWTALGPGLDRSLLEGNNATGVTVWDPDGDGPRTSEVVVNGFFQSVGQHGSGPFAAGLARWDGSTLLTFPGGRPLILSSLNRTFSWDRDGDGPRISELLWGSTQAWTFSESLGWRPLTASPERLGGSLSVVDLDGAGPLPEAVLCGRFVQSSEFIAPQTCLLYQECPPCDPVDFNNDGALLDPQDVDAFMSIYSEGPCVPSTAPCNDVDFNNDGALFDPCDVDSFLLVFSEGPCTLCGE
jgi:hypothetical protein